MRILNAKSLQRTILTGGSALALVFSLAACGGGDTTTTDASTGDETPAEQAESLSTEAAIDPPDIDPGWVLDSSNNVGGTSDLWYPASGSSEEGFYLTNAANDAGVDVTFVDDEGTESSVWDLEIADGHLVTSASTSDKRQVDLTFQDNFSCYDAISQTHYTRGTASEEDYRQLFAGNMFVADANDPSDYMLSFNEDGTAAQDRDGDVVSGTWEVKAVNVAVVHFATDTSEWDTTVRVILDEEGNVVELDDGGSSNLVLYEG